MDIFSYEGGMLVAFLIWIYSVVISLVNINSQFERNLNKVGMRLSWVSLTLKPMDDSDINRPWYISILKYAFIYGVSLLMVLLSWVSVMLSVGMIIYQKSKDSGAPKEVRGFRWKLRNYEMSFDEIVKEMEKLKGANPENFEDAKNEIRESMRERGLPTY